MSRPPDPGEASGLGAPWVAAPDDLPLELDVLRGELYRVLDELARAERPDRERLVAAFEALWERFKARARER